MASSSLMQKVESSSENILKNLLHDLELYVLENPTSDEAKKYVGSNLTKEQREIIRTGEKDEVILAIIEHIIHTEPERLKSFDKYKPKTGGYYEEFLLTQKQWTLTEKGLLRTEDSLAIIRDSRKYLNAERFRAFYTIKHPEKVMYVND